MARASQSFTCTACGATASKWAGRCDSCGEWNSLVEDLPGDGPAPVLQLKKKQAITLSSLATEEAEAPRIISGIAEFDRVCGGGLVPGSALLVGGDPGIGKSTLLLQATAALAARGVRAIYISGEESGAQVKLRA
ncbi:MAG TPA: DNA repair protein RadA, partial [Alphaproteobacteria bacterium]|nr:DNA repair protein RadA [Alphaproteobacteria bacterium]HCO90347.1 DNA repair protein RadA [Alphaproteobacteria bacterium]